VTDQLDLTKESLVMSRKSSAVLLALAMLFGSARAMAQDAQARADLVVEWTDPVLQWNAVLLATVGGKNAVEQQRIAAIAQLAVFEAVNAITRGYAPYLNSAVSSIVATPDASPEAAAIAAAHAVLLHYIPEQAPTLDSARASSLARIPKGPAKDAGIGIGEAAATAMIEQRMNDGSESPEFHVPPSTDPGEWQLTSSCPPRGGPFPHLRNVAPFGIERSDRFRAAPPPSLTSRRYTRDFNEVKALGALDSPNRPADRGDVSRFYAAVLGLPVWNSAAQQVALAQKRSLSENARALALLNMALFDAVISVFETKYHQPFWRPETAIPAADVDDNPKTDPDSSFRPFITTPCHPSYPSAHASLGGAARSILERVYGTGPHAIEFASPAVPDVRLRYASFAEITSDIDDARIYGGIHFRFDQQAGARQGFQVGSFIVRHHLRPARHAQHQTGRTDEGDRK
jgi:hypothetical protein